MTIGENMRVVKSAFAAVIVLGLASPAFSQGIDGNAYHEMCTSPDSQLQNGCTGFGLGIVAALVFWNEIPQKGRRACSEVLPSTRCGNIASY